MTNDRELLTMALRGYTTLLTEIEQKIGKLRAQLQGKSETDEPRRRPNPNRLKRAHRISAAGRARIAAAQRRRWAKARRAKRS